MSRVHRISLMSVSTNPDSKIASLIDKERRERRNKLKIRLFVLEITRQAINYALLHCVHVVVVIRGATTGRLQKLGSHSLFLSPLSQYFLLLSSPLSCLGRFHIGTYNSLLYLFFLYHSPPYLSCLSVFGEFHLAYI